VNQMALTFESPAPLARRSDPATSHAAASSARELQADHYLKIIATLQRYGALGKDGISARCGLTSYQVSKRLTELARLGAIRATGQTVRSTAGRAEREWEAV
jgi:hypothetical protein